MTKSLVSGLFVAVSTLGLLASSGYTEVDADPAVGWLSEVLAYDASACSRNCEKCARAGTMRWTSPSTAALRA